jgi:hypothetical protein
MGEGCGLAVDPLREVCDPDLVVVAIVSCGVGVVFVLIVWGRAAWRSYARAEDFDVSRVNAMGNFPYGFPLVLPLWVLRRLRRSAERDPPVPPL